MCMPWPSAGRRWRWRRRHGRVLRSRAIVEGILQRKETAYGVTTGFGKLSDVAIPSERLAELQVNLIRSHVRVSGRCSPSVKCGR